MADQETSHPKDETANLAKSKQGEPSPKEAHAMEKAQEDAAHERETERGYQ